MSRIIITYFSGIVLNDKYQTPCFYDGLIKALRDAGNDVLEIITSDFLSTPWNGNNKPISNAIKERILNQVKEFKPDLIISFNNSSIEGIEDAVSCPIALWDADMFEFFCDKENVKKKVGRYHFMAFSNNGLQDFKNNLSVKDTQMCRVAAATYIHSEKLEKPYNISFIGNPFFNNENLVNFVFNHRDKLQNILKEQPIKLDSIKKDLIESKITESQVAHLHSGDRRSKITAMLGELGCHIFGPLTWLDAARFNIDLALYYHPEIVYSLNHNQLIYNRSKISLNINHTQTILGYPWRVPDILASNSVLLSGKTKELEEDIGKHVKLLYYDSPADAYFKAKQLLTDEQLRNEIIVQSNELVELQFRWQHRFPLIEQLTGVNLTSNKAARQGSLVRIEPEGSIFYSLNKKIFYLIEGQQQSALKTTLVKQPKKLIRGALKKIAPEVIRHIWFKQYLNRNHEFSEYS